MTMNDESSSKQTFKITLTCQLAPQSISHLGEVKAIAKQMLAISQRALHGMRHDYEVLRVTPTVHVEVSHLPSSHTKKPSSTKARSLRSTTSATSADTEEVVVFNNPSYKEWVRNKYGMDDY
jgi:hypothetical protein